MILDSSVLVAIMLREPGHDALVDLLASEEGPGIGAPTLAETGIVLCARLDVKGRSLLARFVEEAALIEIPFEPSHWPVAVDAFARYGKGRHPAKLNFGDCLTYATAKLAGEPLLALGSDFSQTDIALAGRE